MVIQLRAEYVCYLGDGDVSIGVLLVNDCFHFIDLEAVDDDANDGLFGAGIPASRFNDGDAATEDFGKPRRSSWELWIRWVP